MRRSGDDAFLSWTRRIKARDRRNEAARVVAAGPGEHLFGASRFDDVALAHHDGPRAEAPNDVEVVADIDQRRIEPLAQIIHE